MKKIVSILGVGLASLLSPACSDEQVPRLNGKLEVTLWSDFNENGKYDSGEDIGLVGEEPIYFSNKFARVKYAGNSDEQEISLYLVTDRPHLVVRPYNSTSKTGMHRLDDNIEFMQNLNNQLKVPGNYVLVARSDKTDNVDFYKINSASSQSLTEEINQQLSENQPMIELQKQIHELKSEIIRLKEDR